VVAVVVVAVELMQVAVAAVAASDGRITSQLFRVKVILW
jgi:hypothetical protein